MVYLPVAVGSRTPRTSLKKYQSRSMRGDGSGGHVDTANRPREFQSPPKVRTLACVPFYNHPMNAIGINYESYFRYNYKGAKLFYYMVRTTLLPNEKKIITVSSGEKPSFIYIRTAFKAPPNGTVVIEY